MTSLGTTTLVSNERTPLLLPSSAQSVVTDPGVSFDGATHSVVGTAGHMPLRRPRRHQGRRMRRYNSDPDMRPLRRPLIASPFMPTVATQTASAERRRAAAAAAAGPPRVERIAQAKSSPTSNGKQRYGALKTIDDGDIEDHQADGEAQRLTGDGGDQPVDEDNDGSSSSSSGESSSDDSSITRISDMSGKQWAAVCMLAIANLCSTIAFSCIAPFYPAEAQLKGLNAFEIGVIFGAFELVMFVTAPVLGKYMSAIGSKRMFSFGIFLTGVTAIAFGFLNLLPAGRTFFWASLSIRCAEALGDAAFVTSSFVISAKCFPGRIATIVGIMETFAGLGYTAGPVIGGVLYEYGGFQLPFIVLGALLVLATVLSLFLIEDFDDDDDETTNEKGMLSMLKIPIIWIMVFAVVICAISLSFFDPTLSDHLASFNLSTTMVGVLFLFCGGIYTATAPFWGLMIDRWNCCNALMVFGSSATIFSMLFIGPSPLLNMEKNLVLISISLAVLGVAAGALYIPTFQNCLDAVKEYGYDDSYHTYGCVSGVFQSAFAFGAFIGPTLGGLSVQWIGFPWTTTIIGGINVVFVFALSVVLFVQSRWKTVAAKDSAVPQV